jgi:hypothetical protein
MRLVTAWFFHGAHWFVCKKRKGAAVQPYRKPLSVGLETDRCIQQ